ncbi:polymeric immunoglobulin receptor-like [Solea senegalensis]|uniref:uncharacterized protein LOC122767744 n=1 Tax=Solea senegalensis TaxID=28829 RepID=UPI001C422170|nr:uncharacterized protein LOC122767744 [Solea senegalensis]KAG7494226.1 polymeric immunoglobulin receptor-like [Solea senegalensis]
MKIFLLLILSLITGCEASSEVQGCLKGWFEFNCTNSDPKVQIIVHRPKHNPTKNNPGDRCEKDKKFCLYRDKLNKNLTVVVNKLEPRDFGDYWCKIGKSLHKIELDDDKRGCQTKLFQTVWETATTNFTCDRIKTSSVTFLCKEDGFKCTEMIWTVSTTVSNEKFTLTVSPRVFTIEIRQVSVQDAGVYWCGLRSNGAGRYHRTALKEIQLEVQNIPTNTTSAAVGQTLTYSCQYEGSVPIKKFVCKGEEKSKCERQVDTQRSQNERFSIKDDRKNKITITLKHLTREDTGIYWCGAESTRPRTSDQFFHKLVLTVESPPSTTPCIHPRTHSSTPYSTSSTQSTTASVERENVSWLIGVIAAVTCVAVTGLLVFICRRVEGLKNTANEGAENEDHCYAEIQELPQKSDSGTAPKTVYATTSFSLTPYSVVQLPNSCGDMWSTVTGDEQAPTYSTVNEPPTLTDTAVCYTHNKPQQQ